MNGIVVLWYQTWEPGSQFATLAVGGVVAVLGAFSAVAYRLHTDAVAERADHEQDMAVLRDPHARWIGQITEQRRQGDPDAWRRQDNEPPAPAPVSELLPPVETTVDRIFHEVLPAGLPQRVKNPAASPVPAPVAVVSAAGRAAVPATPPQTDPDQTMLLQPVVPWRGYRQ